MSITFVSCFYIIKSKVLPEKYIQWMNNFISIVKNFNLVIFTDSNTVKYINTKNNSRIKVIIKELNQFFNYKYKDYWIANHKKNHLLNDRTCWELNMLWAEKIAFVKETVDRKYFNTEFYGWCDIGYFRNRSNDLHTNNLMHWPDSIKINNLDKNKIVYACINTNENYINYLIETVQNKNDKGLPIIPIPPEQNSIAGGFFILHKQMIYWWFNCFDNKLSNYFLNGYLVKDDQMILVDCIFSNLNKFTLFKEFLYPYDNWFMFQRILN
jgi:hypothetical protein